MRMRQAAIVAVIGIVVLAGCSGVPGGKEGPSGEAPMHLDAVPSNATALSYVEDGLIKSKTTKKIVNNVLSNAPSGQSNISSYQELLSEVTSKSDVNLEKWNSLMVFGKVSPPTVSASPGSERTRYGAAIVGTEWSENRFISLITRNSNVSVSESTYNGKTVYAVTGKKGEEATRRIAGTSVDTLYVGVLGDGRFVVGVESAVKDSIDTLVGDMKAVSGNVKQQLLNHKNGYVAFSMVTTDAMRNSSDGLMAKADYIAGSYYSESGSRIGVKFTVQMNTSESAKLLKEQVEGGLATVQKRFSNETVISHVKKVDISLKTTTVTVEYETSVSKFNELVDWIFKLYLRY